MTYPYLTQIVHVAARTRPDETFLVCGDRSTTAAGFRDRVARLAGGLRELGVGPDERVGILSLNSDRVVEVAFACWWAGAVPSPVNVRWTVTELAYALDDCGAAVLVVDDPFLPLVAALREQVPSLRAVVHLGDGGAPDGASTYGELAASAPIADVLRSGDDLAYVLYTGGTTGFPKGVMISHANLWTASMGMLAVGCGPGPVYLNAVPLFHIAGIQMLVGHLLGAQGAHVVLPAFDPAAVLAGIARHRVTDVMLVPTMLQMVLASPAFADADVSSLRTIYYGAAPMTEALLRDAMAKLPGVGFIQGYGMTETALTVMLPRWYYTDEGMALGKTASVGRVLPGTEIAIRDAQGREVPPGTVGEVTVRGATVMRGYVDKPEATAEAVRDGWLRSGDAGYLDDEGFLHLVDRIKDMIITGGENVYSIEVERVLALHPAVRACAVIGVPHETWGEQVHAVVVLDPAADVSDDDLVAHCRASLAGYKVPRSFERSEGLPLSAAGKVLKTELRARRS